MTAILLLYSVTVTVTIVFTLRFPLKDQKRITVIYIYSAKARLNKTFLRQHLKDVVLTIFPRTSLKDFPVLLKQFSSGFQDSEIITNTMQYTPQHLL